MKVELIVFLCILVGVLVRTLVPAMRRRKEELDAGEPWEWDHRYTFTAVLSIVVGIVSTFIGFLVYPVPTVVDLYVVVGAVVYGFGLDAIITEVVEWT